MTFENHGTIWHIDHIIPCKRFNLKDKEERLKCFNWSNLQPLYSKDNCSKQATIRKYEIDKNSENIEKFLMKNKTKLSPTNYYSFDRMKYLDNS